VKCPDANRVIFLIPTSQTTLDLGKCFSCNPVKVLPEDLMPMYKFSLLLVCLLLIINLGSSDSSCVSSNDLHIFFMSLLVFLL